MPIYSFAFVMALACAAFFFKGGQEEGSSGLLWAGLSLIVSAVVMFWLHGGVAAVLFSQVGVLMVITLFRVWRDPR